MPSFCPAATAGFQCSFPEVARLRLRTSVRKPIIVSHSVTKTKACACWRPRVQRHRELRVTLPSCGGGRLQALQSVAWEHGSCVCRNRQPASCSRQGDGPSWSTARARAPGAGLAPSLSRGCVSAVPVWWETCEVGEPAPCRTQLPCRHWQVRIPREPQLWASHPVGSPPCPSMALVNTGALSA